MKVSEFSEAVAVLEGRKKGVNIAQIKEVLKCINELMDGEFYKQIRKLTLVLTLDEEV